LNRDGLQGSVIGVLRELSEDNPDPEIKVLFEQALKDLNFLGAVIIDPVVIPNFSTLKQNQWCAEFRKDIESFLAIYVKNDSLQTLEDIIKAGTRSKYAKRGLEEFAEHSGRYENPDISCSDPYMDLRRIAFREAIEKVMDSLHLDAIVYPSWNNKPARISSFEMEYKGDNSQVIAPHTGQPAFTIPMGFSNGHLPAGLQFLGKMYNEPTLIKLVYSYEQWTKHRLAPDLK
jgi:Asp-tRNA(Asn)/Glu-tRNA(Gln) amidotransferase A subunit family amidase